jgi:hypothetical protein
MSITVRRATSADIATLRAPADCAGGYDNSNVAHPAQDDTSGDMPDLTVRPLTADRWADLEALFARGCGSARRAGAKR